MHSGVNNPCLGLLNGIDNGCGFFGLSPYSTVYWHLTILIIMLKICFPTEPEQIIVFPF